MTSVLHPSWHEANQRHLMSAVKSIHGVLTRKGAMVDDAGSSGEASGEPAEQTIEALSPPPALERLCVAFGLSTFERDILLLCAGVELDSAMAEAVALANGDPRRVSPNFSLALAALSNPHWSALSPNCPLRLWRLIEVGNGESLTRSSLRIDERVLHYLTGISDLDERLRGMVEPVPLPTELPESQQRLVSTIVSAWSATKETRFPVIHLCGHPGGSQRSVSAAACAQLGTRLFALSVQTLPQQAPDLDAFIRLWQREAVLGGDALLLEEREWETLDTARELALTRVLRQLDGYLLLCSRTTRTIPDRPLLKLRIGKPTPAEQGALWRSSLGVAASRLNGKVDALSSQFDLDADTIRLTSAEALHTACSDEELETRLWAICQARVRPRLDELAEHIVPASSWDDLVLPEAQKNKLREIATHVRHRTKVYQTWGFAETGQRGLGISALFSGQSGTGKTMAAEVLARELKLDLYRIDLSRVVSKYIGETEVNLRRVFDAAEGGNVILLFDEADALFGKRSEVKDSHDRYANIEISYLLQRMEAYRGLAILTTNMKGALDQAFLRRIRFAVQFPFPDTLQRAEIWRRVFPKQMPMEPLDFASLARLQVSGGNIRSIAMNAAFLAADTDRAVSMDHLLQAARGEYAKLERPFTDVEIGARR